MKQKIKAEYWFGRESYIVFCDDILSNTDGFTIVREAEYQPDLDRVVITDFIIDKNDEIIAFAEINENTLCYLIWDGKNIGKYNSKAPITREEYDELAAYVKKRAGVKVHVYKDNKIVEYTPTEFVAYRFIDEDNVDSVTCETLESAKQLIDKYVK